MLKENRITQLDHNILSVHSEAAPTTARLSVRIERRQFRKASNKLTRLDAPMTTHFECFLTNMRNGIAPHIYAHKPDGCDFYRLYDGNRFFAGNYRNNACVASVLTLEEALKTIDLSLRFPHIFAEMFL